MPIRCRLASNITDPVVINIQNSINHIVVSVTIQRVNGVFTCRCDDQFDTPRMMLNHAKACVAVDQSPPSPSSPIAPIGTNAVASGFTPVLNRLSLESVAENDLAEDEALVFRNQNTSHHSSFYSW